MLVFVITVTANIQLQYVFTKSLLNKNVLESN